MVNRPAVLLFAFVCLFAVGAQAHAQDQRVGVEVTQSSPGPGTTATPGPTSSAPSGSETPGTSPGVGPSVLGATAAPGGPGGPLPFTGLELLRLLAVALVLIVLGVALRSLGRWADRRSSGVDR